MLCWTLSLVRFVLSTLAAVKGIQMTTIQQYQTQWKWLLTTVLALSVADDVIIAAALCYYLSKQKEQSIQQWVSKLLGPLRHYF